MNEFKPKYDRRSIRLREYDYTQPGAYFLTICVHDRKSAFGEIVDGQTRLNDFGQVVETEWFKTGKIRNNVKLHQHVVMPNHFHGILWITETVGATRRVAPTLQPNSLGSLIGQFKSIVTKQIRKMGLHEFKWQRNYYEHIIRNEDELNRIREYIMYNPRRWQFDRDNLNGSVDEMEKKFWNEFE